MPCPKEGWRGHCAQKWGQEEPPICDRTWCWSRFGCLRHFCPAASFGWTPIVAGWQPQQPERALIHYSFRQDRGNGSPSPPWRCQMFRIKPSVGRPKFQTFKWQLHLVGNRFPTGPLSITSIHGLSLWDCCITISVMCPARTLCPDIHWLTIISRSPLNGSSHDDRIDS